MGSNSNRLSRRGFLKGAGIGALSVGAASWGGVHRVFAQTSPSSATVTALSRFNVGDFEVTALQDAVFPLDAAIFGANAPDGGIDEVLTANNVPGGSINTSVTVLLVNTGSELILLDTGNGAANGGRLLATLELIGITPDAINAVVISHYHGDHIGGMRAGSVPTFPNAAYYFPQAEWDFMQNAPSSSPEASTIRSASSALRPIIQNDQLSYYAAEGEIIPGIQAVPAPGHSPGHSALLVVSGENQLLNLVDSALNAVISLAHPDWFAAFDVIPGQASESRVALLTRAAEEGLQVFGYHFPFPGVGYVVAEDEGFRFTPAF
ncbi:MAG: MBL fold metallo-hydrolase [Chitinophagaceae bacterium]|nr:MBL fold metallo-hydrolase [Anaerolineae bacterium]